jgi:hypothetical protein
MSNPLSMFHDDPDADGVRDWSMTRVVAFLFAMTYCIATVRYAENTKDINWPWCVLGVVTLLAVPLQALFRYIQEWFSSSPDQKLLGTLLEKVTTIAAGSTSTTVHTEEHH